MTEVSSQVEASTRRDRTVSIRRWVRTSIAFGALAFVCSQHHQGGMKGRPVPLLNVGQTIIMAAIVAVIVRIQWRSVAGRVAVPFLAGIAGVFASGEPRYGVYGGVVGLLVGVVVTATPLVCRKKRATHIN